MNFFVLLFKDIFIAIIIVTLLYVFVDPDVYVLCRTSVMIDMKLTVFACHVLLLLFVAYRLRVSPGR